MSGHIAELAHRHWASPGCAPLNGGSQSERARPPSAPAVLWRRTRHHRGAPCLPVTSSVTRKSTAMRLPAHGRVLVVQSKVSQVNGAPILSRLD